MPIVSFQKVKYIYHHPIPPVRSSYTLNQKKKCLYNLYFSKYLTTASRSRQPNVPPPEGGGLKESSGKDVPPRPSNPDPV